MTRLPKDFREFLQLLDKHNVRYLLIGGYAVGYHGYPRATADIDIWIEPNISSATKIVQVLSEFGIEGKDLSKDLFLQTDKIVRLGNPPLRIEIMTSISGVDFISCYVDKVEDFIDDIPVKIISLEHLKINKRSANRHKDLDDLEKLR
jgi:predicted nucleotidyltransferase